MAMNTKASSAKKLKGGGFMCHSEVSVGVCVPHEYRSLRRAPDKTKYVRLGDRRREISPEYSRLRRSFHASSLKRDVQENKPREAAASSLPTYSNVFQVVVMKVSIHCQGCAAKLKKHITKMEGVTSFSIDLESKRVTVIGHVSPSGVLESVSKVKKAEFWPCT